MTRSDWTGEHPAITSGMYYNSARKENQENSNRFSRPPGRGPYPSARVRILGESDGPSARSKDPSSGQTGMKRVDPGQKEEGRPAKRSANFGLTIVWETPNVEVSVLGGKQHAESDF